MGQKVTIGFLGDVMLGRGVRQELAHRPPESFWGSLRPQLLAADAVIANCECAITTSTTPWRYPKVFHFGAAPEAVEILKAGNIRCVSLANNHTLDFEIEGLLDTLHYLDQAGITHAGAGRTLAEAQQPAWCEVGGLRIAMLALTDNEPPFAAGPERPGTHYRAIGEDPSALEWVAASVAQVRQAGADLVVLSAHWGPNMVVAPPTEFQAFARGAIDRGIDVFHGHSAHVFQGVERRSRGLILYDTGDALDDYAIDPELRNDWSFLFLLELEAGRLSRLRLLPLQLSYTRTELASSLEREAISARMRTLSAPFGTRLIETPEGLELPLSASRAV